MDASAAAASPRRRRNSSSSSSSPSPEFEFWIAPQPQLHTADELFSDGLLLPLHLLRPHCPTTSCGAEPPLQSPSAPASVAPSASCSPAWASRRWRSLFNVGEKKKKERGKDDRKSGGGAGTKLVGAGIWPFYRSRSDGSAATACGSARSWAAATYAARQSSSAPCSRSNSPGESSKYSAAAAADCRRRRRRAASPGRSGGVCVGRSSPVWQIRAGSKGVEPVAWRRADRRSRSKSTAGERLSVNACIGYRCHVTCRDDGRKGFAGGDRKPFSLRSLVSKKVY